MELAKEVCNIIAKTTSRIFVLNFYVYFYDLQCFEAVGWAAGRASGL